jgi:hypothetical protein
VHLSLPHQAKYYLQRYLPTSTYDFIVRKRRGWQSARQRAAWKAQQIAIVLQCGSPHLSSPERECFYAELESCETYLEYGSGGSTLLALTMVPVVISVENDRAFYRAVVNKGRLLAKGQYLPVFVNIGRTSLWGEPVLQRQTALRKWLWRRYAIAPWRVINRKRLCPDLIFIDGRFRVACALESLLRLPPESACRIFFDDFEQYNGAYYHILEFVEDVGRCGRAIIFRRAANFDQVRCKQVLSEYYEDYR